jgi:hypothetical protein
MRRPYTVFPFVLAAVVLLAGTVVGAAAAAGGREQSAGPSGATPIAASADDSRRRQPLRPTVVAASTAVTEVNNRGAVILPASTVTSRRPGLDQGLDFDPRLGLYCNWQRRLGPPTLKQSFEDVTLRSLLSDYWSDFEDCTAYFVGRGVFSPATHHT